MPSNFREKVFEFVKTVPKGKVVTYGLVAGACGSPRAARQVGFSLASLELEETDVPWWRVVNGKGYLSINQGAGGLEKKVQKSLLEAENIEVSNNFEIDLSRYLWRTDV